MRSQNRIVHNVRNLTVLSLQAGMAPVSGLFQPHLKYRKRPLSTYRYEGRQFSIFFQLSPSEVNIEGEPATPLFVLPGRHHAGLLILTHTLLEEVSLPLQRDQLHPVERIRGIEKLRVTKSGEQSVRDKLDVSRHELAVHTDEVARQCFTDEAAFDFHGTADNTMYHILGKFILKHTVQQTCKFCMQTLIARDELVRKGKSRHQATFLQPINGTEGAAEKNTLHSSKGHDTFSETVFHVHPLYCPLCLLLHRWHRMHRIEQFVLFSWIFNILLDE